MMRFGWGSALTASWSPVTPRAARERACVSQHAARRAHAVQAAGENSSTGAKCAVSPSRDFTKSGKVSEPGSLKSLLSLPMLVAHSQVRTVAANLYRGSGTKPRRFSNVKEKHHFGVVSSKKKTPSGLRAPCTADTVTVRS